MTAPTLDDVKTLLQHHADAFDLVDGRDANGVLLSDYYRVALAALEKADEVEAARGNLILQTICRLPEVLTEGDWQQFLDEHRDEWLSDDRAFGGWISERMRAALADAERWRAADRLAKLWIEEGCWCIPARDMLSHLTFADAIDAEVRDAARREGA